MAVKEREALEALVNDEGWKVFCRHVEQEWGTQEGGGATFLNAVRNAANDASDANATAFLRQIVCAQREIHRLMQWPVDELKRLQQQEQELQPMAVPLSRRGGL